jgi:sulfide:quinone oxidoreductase
MGLHLPERLTMNGEEKLKVVIAGGGIAAVEGMLALHELARSRIDLEVVAPNEALSIPALGVAEPFGLSAPPAVPLADVCRDMGAARRRDSVRSVDIATRTLQTERGDEIAFDALLVAIGATAETAVPGAITYRGPRDNAEIRKLLSEVERSEVARIAFAVPTSIQWPLPTYELALLTATELENQGMDAELFLVTNEASPLSLFGKRASDGVRELLEGVGVELITNAPAAEAGGSGLALHDGRILPADRVVASPRLTVPPIEGIPQGPEGFIGTDSSMRVEGMSRVYAAGDATWFPIKQGGVATQQADVAATVIASLVDPDIEIERFRPTLRGVLFTGGAPRFLRTAVGQRTEASTESVTPLWWPPAKVAGTHLAPYLAKLGLGVALQDLEPLNAENPEEAALEQRDALELALSAAEADAHSRDYRAALRWLDVAQQLSLALPEEYDAKRREWEDAAAGG